MSEERMNEYGAMALMLRAGLTFLDCVDELKAQNERLRAIVRLVREESSENPETTYMTARQWQIQTALDALEPGDLGENAPAADDE